MPRVIAALLAGAALALAGTLVQAVTRNPLAEPGVLGVSGGAALGAVLLVTTVPVAGSWGVAGAAFARRRGHLRRRLRARRAGRLPAEPAGPRRHRGVRRRGGADQPAHRAHRPVQRDEGADLAVRFDVRADHARRPARRGRARAVGVVVAVARRTGARPRRRSTRTPRGSWASVCPGQRLGFLVVSVLLSATAVAAAGTIGFVGLVAPHAARALVGRRHVRVVPVARPPRCASLVCLGGPAGPHGDRPGPARAPA